MCGGGCWVNDLVSEVSTVQVWEPGFGLQHPCKSQTQWCRFTTPPVKRRKQEGRSLWPWASPSSQIGKLQAQWETLCTLHNKVESVYGRHTATFALPMQPHTCAHIYEYIYTKMQGRKSCIFWNKQVYKRVIISKAVFPMEYLLG